MQLPLAQFATQLFADCLPMAVLLFGRAKMTSALEPSIYFYEVPDCAREKARGEIMKDDAEGSLLSPPSRLHLRGMLRQILAIEEHLEREHRVATPEEASLFFIPAYFPLLFWLDQDNTLSDMTFTHFSKKCVNHHSIQLHAGKTVSECKALCIAEPACMAFEFGVAYGGGGAYQPGDCQPKSNANSSDCDGSYHNLDLYVKDSVHLQCVSETFARVGDLQFLARHAGYDHLLIYGYEYPHWKRLHHLVLDTYSPFMANALLLAVSFWSQGRRSALLNAGLYNNFRIVAIPYFATWDCSREQELLESPRDFAITFTGSVKNKPPYFVFRERIYVSEAVEFPRFKNDSRILIEVFPADNELRYSFARNYERERASIYARSDFCLVMPGDGNTAGRLFDVMVAGCVPVLIFHPDTYPVLPFPKHLPWLEFSIVEPVANKNDAAAVLDRLLLVPPDARNEFRNKVIKYAPFVALALKGCPTDTQSALSLISTELLDRTRWLVADLLPIMQTAPPPKNAKYWLQWGPVYHP